MPSTVKVRVVEARDLPVMDRNLQGDMYTDPYVEINFASNEKRTNVRYKTFAPVWNEDFRFEVADDSVLQAEPIEFRVMDHDVYTADDPVGVVHVDLSPLLARIEDGTNEGLTIQGWFPIFDTLRGVRGELFLMIKLQFIGDENPFRDSSAGVLFFSMSTLEPSVYTVVELFGFVEELVVDSDPEFEWMDRARSARTSNESRLSLLYQLGSIVRRQLGKKVLELGGNAVLAYRQHFDVEGDSGIVARAYGTAGLVVRTKDLRIAIREAKIDQQMSLQQQVSHDSNEHLAFKPPTPKSSFAEGRPGSDLAQLVMNKLYNSWGGHDPRVDTSEVPLLTLDDFDNRTRLHMGGIVMARSVKFLGKLASSKSDEETRDAWWIELREEVRSHAKSLCCTHIIGYNETCSIFDDVCILTAIGTAATLRNLPLPTVLLSDLTPSFATRSPSKGSKSNRFMPRMRSRPCSVCHVPYRHSLAPFANMRLVPCAMCGRKWVPELILASIEPWKNMPIRGQPVVVQSRVCRPHPLAKVASKNAEKVSEALPFLEYELQRQLILKLKVLGMNAAFSFESQVHVGADILVGVATATAVYLEPLPAPPRLRVVHSLRDDRLMEMQRRIEVATDANREALQRQAPVIPVRANAANRRKRLLSATKVKPRSIDDDSVSESQGRAADDENEALNAVGGLSKPPSMESSESSEGDSSSSSSSSSEEDEDKTPGAEPLGVELDDDWVVSASQDEAGSDEDRRTTKAEKVYSDDRAPFVLEIDDETDEDIMAVLLEKSAPPGMTVCNSSNQPAALEASYGELITTIQRVKWNEYSKRGRLNEAFNQILQEVFTRMCLRAGRFIPCSITRVKCHVRLIADGTMEVMATATILREERRSLDLHGLNDVLVRKQGDCIVPAPLTLLYEAKRLNAVLSGRPSLRQMILPPPPLTPFVSHQSRTFSEQTSLDPLTEVSDTEATPTGSPSMRPVPYSDEKSDVSDEQEPQRSGTFSRHMSLPKPWLGYHSSSLNEATSPAAFQRSPSSPTLHGHSMSQRHIAAEGSNPVILSSLHYVPRHRITRYLGVVSLHFIKEQLVVRSQTEVSAFYQTFLLEVNAMVRAHACALGANALLCYTLTPEESQGGRNQVYHMVSILGHAVVITDLDALTPDVPSRRNSASMELLPPLELPPTQEALSMSPPATP